MDPNAGSEIDLAYHLASSSWNKGYATEAVVAVLGHGLGSVGLDRVMAVALPENVGSWRVMEKAGMRYEGTGACYGLEGLKRYGAERDWWKPPQMAGVADVLPARAGATCNTRIFRSWGAIREAGAVTVAPPSACVDRADQNATILEAEDNDRRFPSPPRRQRSVAGRRFRQAPGGVTPVTTNESGRTSHVRTPRLTEDGVEVQRTAGANRCNR